MTVEISNRHWVTFKHPDAGYEYRARFAKVAPGDTKRVEFIIERRITTVGWHLEGTKLVRDDEWERVDAFKGSPFNAA